MAAWLERRDLYQQLSGRKVNEKFTAVLISFDRGSLVPAGFPAQVSAKKKFDEICSKFHLSPFLIERESIILSQIFV